MFACSMVLKSLIFAYLVIVNVFRTSTCFEYDPPDFVPLNYSFRLGATNKELIEGAGYSYEYHQVTTEDGYIVSLHRVVSPNSVTQGHPILMLNGVGIRSRCWILRGKGYDLPFVLVDAGYDVWLGDQRGNPTARGHVKLKVTDKNYWNFSFHETGIYDIPAMIDYILDKTSQPKLSFVGQSLGSSFYFVLISERSEYKDKILSSVHFAPLVNPPRLEEMTLFTRSTILLGSMILTALERSKLPEVYLDPILDNALWNVRILCDPSPLQHLCYRILQSCLGVEDIQNYDTEHLGYQMGASFGSTSFKTARHMVQLFTKGCLCKFDYGPKKNMEIYGSAVSPKYNFTLGSPTAIFYGKQDNLVIYPALQRAIKTLGSYVRPYLIQNFTHFDLAFGRSGPKQAYTKVLRFFNEIQANETTKQSSLNEYEY